MDANDVTGTLVKAGSQLFFCEQSSQIQYCQEHFTMWGLIPLVSAEDGTCLSVCLSVCAHGAHLVTIVVLEKFQTHLETLSANFLPCEFSLLLTSRINTRFTLPSVARTLNH